MPGRHWFNREKRLKALGTNEEGLKNLVLAPSIKNRMQFISRSAMKTKANKAPFRHLLIYGPPGTGKTLFAKTMSHESGLDYAVLTGGDISQLGIFFCFFSSFPFPLSNKKFQLRNCAIINSKTHKQKHTTKTKKKETKL